MGQDDRYAKRSKRFRAFEAVALLGGLWWAAMVLAWLLGFWDGRGTAAIVGNVGFAVFAVYAVYDLYQVVSGGGSHVP